MPTDKTDKTWEQRLRNTVAEVEQEVHRTIAYVNDEVVPDIRRNGSEALRSAAAELSRLAQRMDDHQATRTTTPPPPPADPKP